jgi:hypothetical protein
MRRFVFSFCADGIGIGMHA